MPMRRRYAPKRRLIRRKRLGRRPMRVVRSVRQPVQYFKRSIYLSGNKLSSTANDVFFAESFTLSQVAGSSDFTSLYDQYRINGVKYMLIPRGNTAEITAASGASAVYQGQSTGVFSIIDYDDNTAPTSISQLMEYQNVKMTRAHQMHSRYIKPRLNLQGITNIGTGATGQIMNTRGWLDCTNTNVPHFGLKFALQQSVNYNLTYDVKIDFYLAFKNVR